MKNLLNILFLSLLLAGFVANTQAQSTETIQELHQDVNRYRESKGLDKMRLLREMCSVAQQHAEDMAAGRTGFSHDGFEARVQRLKQSYHLSSYSAAENLFFTTSPRALAQQSLDGWIKSPGHHKNLKGEFVYTGIGIARGRKGYYVVQIYLNGS